MYGNKKMSSIETLIQAGEKDISLCGIAEETKCLLSLFLTN